MDKYEYAALRHANKIIRKYGGITAKSLSPGRPSTATECPISSTIIEGLQDTYSDASSIVWTAPDVTKVMLGYPWGCFPNSKSTARFIDLFDSKGEKEYPHLSLPGRFSNASPAPWRSYLTRY